MSSKRANEEAFLKKALKDNQYGSADRTRRDMLDVTKHWGGLTPIVDTFVFHNGVRKNLVSLHGTVPMRYRGATYHIPIQIYLLDTYPHNAPMVYVKPTANMRVKISRHVDYSGKVYLPCLHEWKQDDDLMKLIQILIITFEELPPVYSVSSQTAAAQPAMPQPINNPNVPYPMQSYSTPYPPNPSMPMPMPSMPQPQTQHPTLTAQDSNSQDFSAQIRTSLITAVSEKITRRLEDIYFPSEIERKTGEQLKEGTDKLERMIRKLEDEKNLLEQNVKVYQNQLDQLNEKIDKASKEEPGTVIDDAIVAPTPLYKQIASVFAEEAALEDTIYYLSEGLRNGRLDLESFQKLIRGLSRKQFKLRATLYKCRQKAGLAG